MTLSEMVDQLTNAECDPALYDAIQERLKFRLNITNLETGEIEPHVITIEADSDDGETQIQCEVQRAIKRQIWAWNILYDPVINRHIATIWDYNGTLAKTEPIHRSPAEAILSAYIQAMDNVSDRGR